MASNSQQLIMVTATSIHPLTLVRHGPCKLVHDKDIGTVSPLLQMEQNLLQLLILVISTLPMTLVRHGQNKPLHDNETGAISPPPLMAPNSQQLFMITATSILPQTLVQHGPNKPVHDNETGTVSPHPLTAPMTAPMTAPNSPLLIIMATSTRLLWALTPLLRPSSLSLQTKMTVPMVSMKLSTSM